MTGNANIIYTPRSDAEPEAEVLALASIYRVAIKKYLETKAAEESDGEDARKEVSSNGSGKSIVC